MASNSWIRLLPGFGSVSTHRSQKGLYGTLKLATASPFNCTFVLMVAICVLTFVVSQSTGNFSCMGRILPIACIMHAWIIAYYAIGSNKRAMHRPYVNVATVYASFITFWGLRLVYNAYRRGGYIYGGKNFPWGYVRTGSFLRNRVSRMLFNLVFVCIFQSALIWAITLPMLSFPADALSQRDCIFLGFLLLLLIFETVCDQQQWNFHNAKRRPGNKTGGENSPPSYGFCMTGVFGYSRHLNLFCEIFIWFTLALAAAQNRRRSRVSWHWWQGVGCVIQAVVISLSTRLTTERLSLKKYPQYALYQSTTPILVPALKSTTAQTRYLIEKTSPRGTFNMKKQ
ncbi:unnamed protein product [Phytomonas sp. Hart1]|nr:unnamed protein product [Phytomonas sp. Hart1]|eukprot:CCW71095.1 unnamed protein product [Phytomonas sp. isolate Hart1]